MTNVGLKRTGAVLAGLATVVVLSTAMDAAMHGSGVFPPAGAAMSDALFALAVAYRTVFGAAGGWVTARLAPDRPMGHALALGVIGTIVSLAGTLAAWNAGPEFGPHWYPLTLVATSIPATLLGARLVRSRAAPAHA